MHQTRTDIIYSHVLFRFVIFPLYTGARVYISEYDYFFPTIFFFFYRQISRRRWWCRSALSLSIITTVGITRVYPSNTIYTHGKIIRITALPGIMLWSWIRSGWKRETVGIISITKTAVWPPLQFNTRMYNRIRRGGVYKNANEKKKK